MPQFSWRKIAAASPSAMQREGRAVQPCAVRKDGGGSGNGEATTSEKWGGVERCLFLGVRSLRDAEKCCAVPSLLSESPKSVGSQQRVSN